MKKLIGIILSLAMAAEAFGAFGVPAGAGRLAPDTGSEVRTFAGHSVGDVIDYVLYTDIVTYINGYPIQSYNINGSTVVIAEDLTKYGFSVVWNGKNRSLSVSLDPQGVISPTYKPSGADKSKNGSRAMPMLYSDIAAYLNGGKVTSYNINGYTVIYVDDLAKAFAAADGYVWSSSARTLNLYTSAALQTQPVQAAVSVASGVSGNIKWALDSNGLLTISGSGDMPDYSYYSASYNGKLQGSTIPWSYYRRHIESVEIQNGITRIGNSSFVCCINLNSITIPSSVTSIGDDAFYYCTSLTGISIPAGVISIGDLAFDGCSSLTSISIPKSVTLIGNWAFSYCDSLASITIPSSVTRMENSVFSGWTSSQTIYIKGCSSAPSTWNSSWADGCSARIVYQP